MSRAEYLEDADIQALGATIIRNLACVALPDEPAAEADALRRVVSAYAGFYSNRSASEQVLRFALPGA
jgi:hypothetical protein